MPLNCSERCGLHQGRICFLRFIYGVDTCYVSIMVLFYVLVGLIVLNGGLAGLFWLALKQRNMDNWLGSYYFPVKKHDSLAWHREPVDVFIAVCDHYEPQRGNLPKRQALELVNRWVNEYPRRFESFRDHEGRPPQHTFFFPQDEYQPEYLDALKTLCDAGFGDVDVHLHHDNDTADCLAEKLSEFRETLFHRHGLLRRDPVTNEIVYGFIHGNWALCNSDPQGEFCGVNEEIKVLLETGCYADFTMPSAPSATQICTINSLYYAWNRPGKPCSHQTGQRAAVGRKPPDDSLLMIQGPLLPDWQRPKWGVLPRIENGDLHAGRPADWRRFKHWMHANVHVDGRPDWRFIKLHTHGCHAGNIDTLLGEESAAFHERLSEYAAHHPHFRFHYVTAWEMAQLVKQAENGATTPVLPGHSPSKLVT